MSAHALPSQENATDTPPEERELWMAIALGTVVTAMTLLAGSVLYAYMGSSFLERRYNSIGEVIMREAERLEKSHMPDKAIERYELALQARFAGEFNRIHCLKRMGILLTEQGEYERAIPYLQEATAGPHADRNAHPALVEALMQTGRLEEAEKALQLFADDVEKLNSKYDKARALHLTGRIAEARGDVETAIAHYRKNESDNHDAASMARLAELAAEQGNKEQALQRIERYFASGAKGDAGDRMRRLYSQLQENR